ncbi:MAG: hypothetical protein KGS72_19260 [Cyanobacteria bacterium REEB67]|nr:hypothetical protein [Cyanobacteria bacterium REEB67]
MQENQTDVVNENDCHKSGSQMLGFMPPGGPLVMSPGQIARASHSPVVVMPIAELFVQHKKYKSPAKQAN